MDGPLSLSGAGTRAMLKTEQDKSAFSRELSTGLNKERLLVKGSSKYVRTLSVLMMLLLVHLFLSFLSLKFLVLYFIDLSSF
jgi:hypothetical protein